MANFLPVLGWMIRPTVIFLLSFSIAYAGDWELTMPTDQPDEQSLCQVLLDRVKNADITCVEKAIDDYAGFESPPWQLLDASKHLELIAKLSRGGTMADAKQFVAMGGTLKIWHTRLLSFFDDHGQSPTPPGDQTVALMSWNFGIFCPTHSSVQGEMYIVLPDLSGPDPRVSHDAQVDLAVSYPVLYKGKTLFVSYNVSSNFYPVANHYENKLDVGSAIWVHQLAKETGARKPVCTLTYDED